VVSQSISAERSLLSCIIKNGDLIKEVALETEHFKELSNQLIFTAMKELDEKSEPIDIVSIRTQLGQGVSTIGGHQTLTDLVNSLSKEENFKTYEKYILDDYKVREAKKLSQSFNEIHSSKDMKSLQEVVADLSVLLEKGEQKSFDLTELLYDIENDVNTEKADISGVPTGFYGLDLYLDGLAEQELTIIGARPSMGKTAFALGMTKNIVLYKENFLNFFSLEMSDKSLLYRIICSLVEIDSYKIKNPMKRFNKEDWDKYRKAQMVIANWKETFAIHDQSKITIQDIRSKVKQNIRRFPKKRHVVVIDYLTLIQGSGRRERHLEVGEISRNLKRMARDLNVHVVLLAQLSRALEQRKDKRPILSDLRDSGEIEQDADKILFLHRDDYHERDQEDNKMEIIIAKNRNGSLGTVDLKFIKEYQRFE
jgi:replicative DNA helicase